MLGGQAREHTDEARDEARSAVVDERMGPWLARINPPTQRDYENRVTMDCRWSVSLNRKACGNPVCRDCRR